MRKIFLYSGLAILVCLTAIPSYSALPSAPSTQTSDKPVNDESSVSVKDAMKDFKNLSRNEKRERFKDVKDAVKKFKEEKRAGNEPSTDTILLVILAIILPPLAVYLHEGEANNRFWLSLLLTLLFWVPGVIYALYIILGT